WIGELRAAAARAGQTGIAGLVLSDATAEMRGGEVTGTVASARMNTIRQQDTLVSGVTAGGIRFRRAENGRTEATVASATAASVRDQDTVASGARATGISAVINADESALVTVERVTLASVASSEFRTGSLNVAGVRLTVSPGGLIEGTTGDVNVGTADLGGGDRAEGVRLARPRFRLEPSGRYRASADLSLGGGVLGKMRLGSVRGALVATGEQIQLNDFVADIFNGRARGSATIGTARGAQSRVTAAFEGVDVGGLAASATGRVVPLTGAATGTVDLRFPGQNFRAATGTLDARFEGATGREEVGLTPLTGELQLRAERGDFQIERANLRTEASELNATGSFSFDGDSNLAVRLNSSDASELQRVLVASGLAPQIEEQLAQTGVELAGQLTFDGTVRGSMESPLINGRFAVASLTMRGRDLGSLSANVESDNTATRITGGRLEERDGGGVTFTATIPREGENNIAFDATLENANAANLLAALGNPLSTTGTDAQQSSLFNPANLAGLGPASGRVSVTGYPGAMEGSADLKIDKGTIGGEPYDEIAARATFSGSKVNLEALTARLAGGAVNASGTVDIETQDFDLRAQGENVRLDVVTALFGGRVAGGRALPALGGIADFTANASGNLYDPRSYRVTVDAKGREVTVNGQAAGELSLVGRTTAENKFVLELTTGILGQPQVVRAEVDLASEALATTVETTLAGADLTQLFATLLPDANVRVEGRATGSLRASGNLFGEDGSLSLAGLQGRAEFSELVVQIEDVPLAAENPLVVLFSTNEVTFERTRFTGPGTNILFGGTAAIREGGRQNLTVEGSLNLRVLNRISPNVFLSGAAEVSVRVGGSYADPRITGTAEVANATFATLIEDERLQVTNINGRVRFNANQAEIETLTGRAGGGRVTVSGGALLAGFRPAQYRLSVRGDDVTVPFPNNFRTTADAALEVSGTTEGQRIRGTVNVRRTEYTEDIDLADLIDRRREISLEEGVGVDGLGQTTLDLQIEGRDALVVRNNLADMVGSISLRVSGPMDDPIITGRVTATRGTLNFRNNRFEIQRAIIDLPPRRDADPVLNVVAESEIRGYRVTATPTGPLSQLSITLRSDPALPQADVVSLITTGDLSSGDQSASILGQSGVGTATSLLTESLVNAPVRRATDKLFGLNRFEIDPLVTGRGGASPTARLTVGRQINRDLSVTYSTNVTGEPQQVVAVEYRLSDRMSFVARYQQGSQNTLRTQNNDFSFEVRFRKRF
ncbi:MAG TPA: translocation/assembly module TamB domain-containing protein, partial [Pyrinomonadaceae bacterium]|nr:translocation/assembly module TamB domain-containing protein [Pyrinomonadaceae bacterium]